MSKTLGFVMFAAVFAFASPPATASTADFSGRWATVEFGELSVEQVRDRVDGSYTWNDGRVSGEVSGNWMSGTWAQSSSGRRCNREELGTFYWGRFKVQLSGDEERWSGGWSYCDDPEATGGGWSGKRVAGSHQGGGHHGDGDHHGGGYADGPAASTTFEGRWATAEFGEARFEESNGRVRGTYAWNDGQVSGDVDGNRLNGIWAQSSSGRRCNSQQLGSAYWGRFGLQLSTDGERWSGGWSYCDEPEATGGGWNGKRIGE